MKASSEEVRKAIIKFGEVLNMELSTPILLKNVGFYSTIKELTMVAFTQNYSDYFEKDNETFNAIKLIKEYCREMYKNGEVNFDN